jgi:hypothetical protein
MSYLCTETMLFLMHNKLGVTGGDDEPHANILALVDADRSVPTHQFHVPDELYAQFLRYCLRDKVAHERARDEDPRSVSSLNFFTEAVWSADLCRMQLCFTAVSSLRDTNEYMLLVLSMCCEVFVTFFPGMNSSAFSQMTVEAVSGRGELTKHGKAVTRMQATFKWGAFTADQRTQMHHSMVEAVKARIGERSFGCNTVADMISVPSALSGGHRVSGSGRAKPCARCCRKGSLRSCTGCLSTRVSVQAQPFNRAMRVWHGRDAEPVDMTLKVMRDAAVRTDPAMDRENKELMSKWEIPEGSSCAVLLKYRVAPRNKLKPYTTVTGKRVVPSSSQFELDAQGIGQFLSKKHFDIDSPHAKRIKKFINKYAFEGKYAATQLSRLFCSGKAFIATASGPMSNYCQNINGCHEDNTIYFCLSTKSNRIDQRCHNPACRDYKSAAYYLDPDVRIILRQLREHKKGRPMPKVPAKRRPKPLPFYSAVRSTSSQRQRTSARAQAPYE